MTPDQSFSMENFRRIWDLRTRRGEDLASLFPSVHTLNLELVQARRYRQQQLAAIDKDSPEYLERLRQAEEQYSEAKEAREAVIYSCLKLVCSEVEKRTEANDFSVPFEPGPTIHGKQTYKLCNGDATSYFVEKQVEQNIRQAFSISPPSRQMVVSQLALTLDNKTSKVVIRTDINQFYESIPHRNLIELLKKSSKVSRTTCRFVEALLKDYEELTGKTTGIPRGLSLSSTLAEAYLSELDGSISMFPGLVLYIRYVDDIVLVLGSGIDTPTKSEHMQKLRTEINKTGLKMKTSKTKYIEIGKNKSSKMTYLGYEFSLIENAVKVDISLKRQQKYKEKIDAAFNVYYRYPNNPRMEQMLVDRVRFLTTNTRLSNNKRNALVGIYFSNSLLTDVTTRIESLDRYLMKKISGLNSSGLSRSAPLQAQLKSHTFAEGLKEKTFNQYSPNHLKRIVRIWKNGS